MPAEYEKQDAVRLGWINDPQYDRIFFDITEALYPRIPIKVATDKRSSLR